MAGNKLGGAKTRDTNKRKWGENFYREIGKRGGRAKVPKGFAVTGLASSAGKIGGMKSRRTSAKQTT